MNVLGGMLFEDLVDQGKNFERQLGLYHEGIIDGCQIQICHPSLVPAKDTSKLTSIFEVLPSGFLVFIHFPGENRGVDVGIRFDERGVFSEYKKKHPHANWMPYNAQAFSLARRILETCGRSVAPYGVSHCGYATLGSYEEKGLDARACAVSFLEVFSKYIVLETMPPVINKDWVNGRYCPDLWPSPIMRCFGGTPECMQEHLERIGTRCLIDFSHVRVAANQVASAQVTRTDSRRYRTYDSMLAGMMALPHCEVCHYSGIPPEECLVPTHEYFDSPMPQCAVEAMATMETVCLEIPWDDTSRERIMRWRETVGF